MSKINCRLKIHSTASHLQQMYTGFAILRVKGLISATQTIIGQKALSQSCLSKSTRRTRETHLQVILNNHINVHYDAHDSKEIDHDFLEEADVYFKRSYCPEYMHRLGPLSEKIYPLGLNYEVYPDRWDKLGFERSKHFTGLKRLRTIAKVSPELDLLAFTPRIKHLEATPNFNQHPQILFIAKIYDPYDKPNRSVEKIQEREYNNQRRADCVRLLRKEFGDSFSGGLIRDRQSEEYFPDLLLPTNAQSNKKTYLKLMQSFPICVATTGLHGSIGWKFAEYVASSKAILCEPLNYEVPGNMSEGNNYVVFNSPEECVEKASVLMSDQALREKLMLNNANYYQSYMKPDALVLRTLHIALSH